MLYRLAEMLEARAAELAALCTGEGEVERAIDRVVWYAGWADKLAQVLGGSNPVAGPYFNFTVPEPTGVVGGRRPRASPPLLGLVSRLAPALVGGNAVVVARVRGASARGGRARRGDRDLATCPAASSTSSPATAASSRRGSPRHMDVNAIDLTGADGRRAELERARGRERQARRARRSRTTQSPWEIAAFLELKTVWHPIGT